MLGTTLGCILNGRCNTAREGSTEDEFGNTDLNPYEEAICI